MTFLVNSTFSYIPWQGRRVYYLHTYKARRYPSKYVANIADGMDQHTTNIPSVRRITKAMSPLTTVGTHLVGSIIHNRQAQNEKEIYGTFVNVYLQRTCKILVYFTLHCHLELLSHLKHA